MIFSKVHSKRIVFINFIFLLTVTNALATTPTWLNNARFIGEVRNTTYYITPSAKPYTSNVQTAAHKWVYTEMTNPIEMLELYSTYATHIDVYAKTRIQDAHLRSGTAAYVTY